MNVRSAVPAVLMGCLVSASASLAFADDKLVVSAKTRFEILQRAQVWAPTDIAAMDLKVGPPGPGAFLPDETVTCNYIEKKMSGHSPKFTCVIGSDDEAKVRYGSGNGEVFAGVGATRLLWALGFGADRMYPVKIICRGCPSGMSGGTPVDRKTVMFDVAAIERKTEGRDLVTRNGEGWAWPELDLVSHDVGGAPRAHRDALKLLAVMLQHSDNKSEQQRVMCVDEDKHHKADAKNDHGKGEHTGDKAECAHPFMLIHDLGLTFGRANRLNRAPTASTNFDDWARTPVWREGEQCVGHLDKSVTGTFVDPVISEEGRQFLSALLAQLTDAQLRDLFEVARFPRRAVARNGQLSNASVDQWVAAFKKKRDEIANRRCGPLPGPVIVPSRN